MLNKTNSLNRKRIAIGFTAIQLGSVMCDVSRWGIKDFKKFKKSISGTAK